MATEQDMRKTLLNAKRSERIIFAVSPELKEAAVAQAEEQCVSLSAYINTLIADDVVTRATAQKGEKPRA